ncbi:MAG: hypothetical protein P8H44_07815 [Flavobacteriaceae bacterium]|nr:hypothetical protein [Flavobacteriaceae bacterium]
MKKFYTILCLTIASLTQLQAQAPQGFNYQATVRNASGDLVVNTNVYFKFNVIQGSQTAVPIFTETHYVPTDDLGQVNLVIGQGTANTGTFSELDWSLGSYYLGIELNTGSSYVAMGTTQLLSVPYALYAENSGNSTPITPNLEAVLAENNSANNQQIKDLQDPTDAQDAATKAYVELLESQVSLLQEDINTINEALISSGQINPSILLDVFIEDYVHRIYSSDLIQDIDGNYILFGSTETDIQGWDLLITKLNNQGETLWSRTYGSNGTDRGASIIQKQDSSGYILCGYVSETSEDVSSGYGGKDIWVIEINNNGELINEVTFGGSQNDEPIQIINSSNGYAIIAETYSNDGDVSFNHSSETDIWVLEISNDLALLNEKTYGAEGNDEATSILEIEPGQFIINGNHSGVSQNWVAKVSWPSGDVLWENDFGGRPRNCGTLKQHNDFIYLATNSYNVIEFGAQWGYLAKISQAGVLVDDFYFGGENLQYGPLFLDLDFDSNGDIYIVGEITSPGGSVTAPTFSSALSINSDILVLKTDGNFNEIWQKSFGGTGRDNLYHLGSPDLILDTNNNPIFLTATNSIDRNVKSYIDNYKMWLVKVDN